MPRRSRRLSTQILVPQLLILAGALVIVIVLALRDAQGRVDEQFERRALGIAQSVASMPEVVRAIARRDRSGVVQRRAEAVRSATGMDFVVVTDLRGIRFSHPDPGRIGERVSTDPSAALAGRTVLAVERGTLGRSARAKVPLRDDRRVVGIVSVGILEEAVDREMAERLAAMGLFLLVALTAGGLAAMMVARRLKRQTFGLELDEIAALVREREAMLYGIREGVVLVDAQGRLLLVNAEAFRLTKLPPDAVGHDVDDVAPTRRLADLLAGRSSGADELLVEGDRLVVANRMAVRREGRDLGSVVTLRDRTELESLVRELDSVRGLTDAMRAQAHEFQNRLHTLAGLLELGEHEQAGRFITEVTSADSQLRRALGERVADQRIAALLLAKSVVAAERGVRLELNVDTRLEEPLRDVREGLTVLGNLIDNAIDAAADHGDERRLVRVLLADDAGALLVRVRDTGPGLAPEARERAFEPGWTTKGAEGRGVGLSLIRQLVERRGGWIEVDDAEGGGATFTAWLPDAVLDEAVAR